jgi:DNA-directed RNA polymerase specialized sigma24 family protein
VKGQKTLSKTAGSRALYNWGLSQGSDNRHDQPTQGDPRFAAALKALSEKDKEILKRFARFKMFPLTAKVRHSDAEDLLHEAIKRTLNGDRKWNPDATVVKHLIGCMSSIASEWYKEASKHTELSNSPDSHQASGSIEAEARLILNEAEAKTRLIIEQTRAHLQDEGDSDALSVLESLLQGHRPAEARQKLNMAPEVYIAAKKRIQRLVRRLISTGR